jgi:DNA-binding LytR/AlgR family response regulator
MLKCLIVDDEPIARSILEKYVLKTPGLDLIGSVDNALEVLNYLSRGEIDLIFLDINMPEFSGIDLLKSMHNPPQVIITTAYAEYGAESYEYDVIDYLLKPISFERFLKAAQRATHVNSNERIQENLKNQPEFLFLKEDNKVHKIFIQDISSVHAFGNYIKVFLEDKTLVVRMTLADFEKESGDGLHRIHKSYMVSIPYIKCIEGNMVIMHDSQRFPIGRIYKSDFEKKLK